MCETLKIVVDTKLIDTVKYRRLGCGLIKTSKTYNGSLMSKNKLFLSHHRSILSCIKTGGCTYFGRKWTLIEYLRHFFMEIFNTCLTEAEQRTVVKTYQCADARRGRTILTPAEVLELFPEYITKTKDVPPQSILHHSHSLHFCHLECVDCWAEHLESFLLDKHYEYRQGVVEPVTGYAQPQAAQQLQVAA